jgi:hypothetical protein
VDKDSLVEFVKSIETLESEEVACSNCGHKFITRTATQECPMCGKMCDQQWVFDFHEGLRALGKKAVEMCYEYYNVVCKVGKKLKDFDVVERLLEKAKLFKQMGDQWNENNHLYFYSDFIQMAESVDLATKRSKEIFEMLKKEEGEGE